MAKIETSVNIEIRRTTANAPSTAKAPTRVGMNAATTLPKMIRLKMNTIGIEIDSARAMSSVTVSLTSPNTAHWPATCVVRPSASKQSLTSS